MDKVQVILEIITNIITITGVPIAIFIYLREQKKLREEREYGTYDALDDKYIELQQLCLEYPDLDVLDRPYAIDRSNMTSVQIKQEETILLIRISIFERAYLMYHKQNSHIKSNQWEGWELEIKEWLGRDNFLNIWKAHSPYFDKKFAKHFNNYL